MRNELNKKNEKNVRELTKLPLWGSSLLAMATKSDYYIALIMSQVKTGILLCMMVGGKRWGWEGFFVTARRKQKIVCWGETLLCSVFMHL